MALPPNDIVKAEGTIKKKTGPTPWMYGDYLLYDPLGKLLYALTSSTLNLSAYNDKYVEISGSFVPGYPIDGGPPYVDVREVQEKASPS